MMKIIEQYFNITQEQRKQMSALLALYKEWNEKINVISRKDIDNLYLHHVLHSLAIKIFMDKEGLAHKGMHILDFGCGGGFPGIPLAIMYPEIQFKLIDSIGKKVKVASEIARAINLKNCFCEHLRGQDEHGKFDLIVSRAVMPLPEIKKIFPKTPIICLKGGDLKEELSMVKNRVTLMPVADCFKEEWFEEKFIVSYR